MRSLTKVLHQNHCCTPKIRRASTVVST